MELSIVEFLFVHGLAAFLASVIVSIIVSAYNDD